MWCDVLGWLQEDHCASAVALPERLQAAQPDRSIGAHLRTLQRRVQQWRGTMVIKRVYAASETTLSNLVITTGTPLIGDDPKCCFFGNILWGGNRTGKAYCR